MATKKKPSNVISDRTWQGHQSWNREVIENIGGVKVRMSIKVDAYDFQSSAKSERWDGNQWQTVHRIPGQQIKSFRKTSYVARECSPAVFDEDLNELRKVTKGVML